MKKRAPAVTRSRSAAVSASNRMRGQIQKVRRPSASSSRRAASKAGQSRGTGAKTGQGLNAASQKGQNRKSAKLTTDHGQIRKWVEARGGHPATVKRTAKGKQAAGILRIDFPGFSGAQSLKPIGWEEWFDTFEERRLGFLYQEKTASGKPSRFNKLVCRK